MSIDEASPIRCVISLSGGSGGGCPTVWETKDDSFIIQGPEVNPETVSLPPHIYEGWLKESPAMQQSQGIAINETEVLVSGIPIPMTDPRVGTIPLEPGETLVEIRKITA